MYLVIFCYWVGPVPYLELFGAGPAEKNTLYQTGENLGSFDYRWDRRSVRHSLPRCLQEGWDPRHQGWTCWSHQHGNEYEDNDDDDNDIVNDEERKGGNDENRDNDETQWTMAII